MTGTLTLKPIPETTPGWAVREAMRLRNQFTAQATWKDGVLYWNSNDRPVPPSCFSDAFVELPAGQQAAHDAAMTAAISAYKQTQASRTAEEIAEERMMARAAMGAGVDMVNIFTGEKYRT